MRAMKHRSHAVRTALSKSIHSLNLPRSGFPRFCTPDQFMCKSTKLCIPKSNLCDTISQCHDRSDEMTCSCPIEDYVSQKLFYRCGLTDKCLPKNIECDIKHECNSLLLDHDEDDDDLECKTRHTARVEHDPARPFVSGSSSLSLMKRPCSMNSTCSEDNQYCRGYFNKRCVCQSGYRMNETTGMCEDIDECRERLVCDHYCINSLGSYRCACHGSYQLQSDKHTCTARTDLSSSSSSKESSSESGRDDRIVALFSVSLRSLRQWHS